MLFLRGIRPTSSVTPTFYNNQLFSDFSISFFSPLMKDNESKDLRKKEIENHFNEADPRNSKTVRKMKIIMTIFSILFMTGIGLFLWLMIHIKEKTS